MLASTRGLSVTADDVLVTRGSQMALSLAARALLRPGDVVAVEEFGYRPAWEAFRAAGATVVPVRIDRDGLDVEALTSAREPDDASRRLCHAPSSVSDDGHVESRASAGAAVARARRADGHHRRRLRSRVSLRRPARACRWRARTARGSSSTSARCRRSSPPVLRVGYIVAPPAVLRSVGRDSIAARHAGRPGDRSGDRDVDRRRRAAAARRAGASRLRQPSRDPGRQSAAERLATASRSRRLPAEWRCGCVCGCPSTSRRGRAAASGTACRGTPGRRYAFDGKPKPFARFSFAWLNETRAAGSGKADGRGALEQCRSWLAPSICRTTPRRTAGPPSPARPTRPRRR